jgi:molybdate transport system ATP-binding protein
MSGDSTAAAGPLEVRAVVDRGPFRLDVAFDVHPGRTLALAGPNGAGKTTIVETIAGVTRLTSGLIRVGARVLADVPSGVEVPAESRRVGVVFQDYLLFPHLTVLDNVAFGPRAAGASRRESRARAAEWLDRFSLSALAGRRPAEISGGQAQRVALARALVTQPDVLLLDEPLAALDVEVRSDVRAELADHLHGVAVPTLVVTHDLEDILSLAADVVIVEGGLVRFAGPVESAADAAPTPYSRRLFRTRADGGDASV